MKEKSKAALTAIGIYLAFNAAVFGLGYMMRWFSDSSIGHWLEIDKPTKPYVPGVFYILQIIPLMIAYMYY
ncbi:MAG TPA: hypothetical protein VFS77_12290, partial [Pyrinomonadaceae bacterium]|nr:hypothetical protein [Pyrinomonadaceae bacterium]